MTMLKRGKPTNEQVGRAIRFMSENREVCDGAVKKLAHISQQVEECAELDTPVAVEGLSQDELRAVSAWCILSALYVDQWTTASLAVAKDFELEVEEERNREAGDDGRN